jgi:hypothetical protein
MVGVAANVLEVIVLAAGTDAELGVGNAAEAAKVRVGVSATKEEGLELVHPGIDEEQRWVVVRNNGAAGNKGVFLALDEEVNKLLSNTRNRPC